MEIAAALVMGIGVLIPSVKKLLDSMAYRHRARGRAELIRARGNRETQRRADG